MEEDAQILEGADLCICCLDPVRPGASLCRNCGAPQDFLATALPFLKILSEGFAYHRAVQTPRSAWAVAGIWVIFGQLAAGGSLALWWWLPLILEYPTFEMVVMGVPFLAHLVLGVLGIATCTINYVSYRRSLRHPEP